MPSWGVGAVRRGARVALHGLTPWSEDSDPDPAPYFRRATSATRDRPFQWPEPPAKDGAHNHHNHHHNEDDTGNRHNHSQPPASPTAADSLAAPPPALAAASGSLRWALSYLVVPAASGAVVGYGLGLEVPGVGLAAVLGLVLRALAAALAETVPFTGRRHNLLLPLPIELMMGEASFRKFLADQRAKGKVLSRRSREHLLVAEVANTIIAAASRGLGGGSQDHMKRFKWEVVTVDDATPNAFVLPGGKVVVHTGLVRLLGGRRELLATVLGHEVAHAMARHSSEKMTIGVLAAIALRFLAAAASRAATDSSRGGAPDAGGADARRRRQQQEAGAYDSRRGVYGTTRGDYDDTRATGGWPLPGATRPPGGPARGARPAAPPPLFFGGGAEGGGGGEDDDYSVGPGSLVARLLEGAGASAQAAAREYARHAAGAAYGPGGGGPQRLDPAHPLMSGQVVQLLNSVLLQLPFSRRAESEADLIGLKLMALAGYDPTHAPETFKLLEGAERGRGGGALAAAPLAQAASLGCTHPRSANRVKALEEEVRAMVEAGPQGYDTVYTHPGYWSL